MDYLLDVNVWIALSFERHPHFQRSNDLVETLNENQNLILCRVTQQGFLRLSTTRSVYEGYGVALNSNADAIITLTRLLNMTFVRFQLEPLNLESLWYKFASRKTASPKVWMDAYLAAFAISADLELVTFDRDFQQYVDEGLKLRVL